MTQKARHGRRLVGDGANTGEAFGSLCDLYRVSTEVGLDQEFNSLDAQYDASAAYIRSQAHAVGRKYGTDTTMAASRAVRPTDRRFRSF